MTRSIDAERIGLYGNVLVSSSGLDVRREYINKIADPGTCPRTHYGDGLWCGPRDFENGTIQKLMT
jgi:hypothetical protein